MKVRSILEQQEKRNISFLFESVSNVSKIRVTTAQEIEKCPRRWSRSLGRPIYKEPIREVESTKKTKNYSLIGTLVHLYVENAVISHFTGQDLDNDFMAEILEMFFVESPEESMNLAKYVARLKKTLADYELLATEQEVQIPVTIPIPVFGQIDAIFRNTKTGEIRIVDHKTNRKPDYEKDWRKKLQVVSYCAAVCEIYGVPNVSFMVGKVNLDSDLIFDMPNPYDEANRRYFQIYQSIMKNADEAAVNDECKYCGFRNECDQLVKINYFKENPPWKKTN